MSRSTRSGTDTPSLVLDAGTGLQRLSDRLDGGPFRGTLLLTHLHWDHAQGLPFFRSGDQPDAEVRLLIPDQQDGRAAVDVLAGSMSPPHFPIRPEGLQGHWTFATLEEGEHLIEGFEVTAVELPHKGGRTFGYRIVDPGGATVVYASDHGPLALGPGEDGHGPHPRGDRRPRPRAPTSSSTTRSSSPPSWPWPRRTATPRWTTATAWPRRPACGSWSSSTTARCGSTTTSTASATSLLPAWT